MNLTSLRLLTWGTVAGSIASAMLLAAGESALPRFDDAAPEARRAGLRPLPTEPTAAGRPAVPSSPVAPASTTTR